MRNYQRIQLAGEHRLAQLKKAKKALSQVEKEPFAHAKRIASDRKTAGSLSTSKCSTAARRRTRTPGAKSGRSRQYRKASRSGNFRSNTPRKSEGGFPRFGVRGNRCAPVTWQLAVSGRQHRPDRSAQKSRSAWVSTSRQGLVHPR